MQEGVVWGQTDRETLTEEDANIIVTCCNQNRCIWKIVTEKNIALIYILNAISLLRMLRYYFYELSLAWAWT